MELKKGIRGNQAPTRQKNFIHSHLITLSAVHESWGGENGGGALKLKSCGGGNFKY